MRINDDWEIVSDPLNIILRQRKVTKEESNKPSLEYWKTAGYYYTVRIALEALVQNGVMGTGLTDLQTVLAKIDELKQTIEGLDVSDGI